MSRPNRHLKLTQSGTAGERAPGNHPRPRRRRVPTALTALAFFMTLVIHPGCVALNLPSERYHDPDDLGGLLGPMKHTHGPMPPTGFVDETYGVDELPRDVAHTGPEFVSDCDSFACDDDEDAAKGKEDPVPWPKYHPVPTRPVFGGTSPFGAAP